MDVPKYRVWMYNRLGPNRVGLTEEFYNGVEEFIQFACVNNPDFPSTGTIRCPCVKCKCTKFKVLDEVRRHLYRVGFQPRYYYWTCHGEVQPEIHPVETQVQTNATNYYWQGSDIDNFNPYEQMVVDAAGPNVGDDLLQEFGCNQQYMNEHSNPEAQKFYDMLSSQASTSDTDGCEQQPIDENAIFLQATGGMSKKGRVYGIGSEARRLRSSSSSSSSSSFGYLGSQSQIYLQQEMEERVARMNSELRETVGTQEQRIVEHDQRIVEQDQKIVEQNQRIEAMERMMQQYIANIVMQQYIANIVIQPPPPTDEASNEGEDEDHIDDD